MFDGAQAARPGPLRLAIISTYDEMCGIAGYTRALEQQLRPHADVTILDLDQYLLRSPHAQVQKLADRHVKDIAKGLKAFDSVNIQLEYGILGRTHGQILRRLRWLVNAAPALSVTFHTVLGHDKLNWQAIGRLLMTGKPGAALSTAVAHRRSHSLGLRACAILRRRQRSHPVNAIVHTARDAKLLRNVFGIKLVDHHPLSFVATDQAERIRAMAGREQFPAMQRLPEGAKVIGSFGFLSPYKGFEIAVRSLHYLPESYHLLVFGGVHPQSIQRERTIDPYVKVLLDEAHIGHTVLDRVDKKGSAVSLALGAETRDLLVRHPQDLHHRLHFLGVHDDEAFMRAMALCDVVVLPYLEVGQSSSGPVAMALEMGCRVLASRTLAFLQFARYHPSEVEFFDIGNFIELAELIQTDRAAPGRDRRLVFNTETNTALYLHANRPRDRGNRRVRTDAEEAVMPRARQGVA